MLKTRTAPGKPGQLGPLTIDVNTDHKMSSLETEDTMLNMLTFLYFFYSCLKTVIPLDEWFTAKELLILRYCFNCSFNVYFFSNGTV